MPNSFLPVITGTIDNDLNESKITIKINLPFFNNGFSDVLVYFPLVYFVIFQF